MTSSFVPHMRFAMQIAVQVCAQSSDLRIGGNFEAVLSKTDSFR